MHKTSVFIALLSCLSLFDGVTAQTGRDGERNSNQDRKQTGQNNNNAAAAAGGLTLQQNLLQTASELDGTPKDGQTASTTSNNNFINFCAGKTELTNGTQLAGGSCNGIPMGDIPSTDNMISAIILNPAVGKTIAPNTPFDVIVQTVNLVAGKFTNPDKTYYAAPQQLLGGKVVGHCHVVIQKLTSFNDATPPSAKTFAFFKGINDDGNGRGLLKATVSGGLAEGFYRVCTMMGTMNHQPPLMPLAQRGAQDDCTKFEVTADGATAATGQAASGGRKAGQNDQGGAKAEEKGRNREGAEAGQKGQQSQAGQDRNGRNKNGQTPEGQGRGQRQQGQKEAGPNQKGAQAQPGAKPNPIEVTRGDTAKRLAARAAGPAPEDIAIDSDRIGRQRFAARRRYAIAEEDVPTFQDRETLV